MTGATAPAATPPGVPAATYRLQVHAGFRLRGRRRGGRLPGRPRGDARVLLSPAALGRGQQPRLRHRRPRAHRRGARRAGGLRPVRRRPARARARPGARPGAQPHGRRRRRRPRRGGGTCCSTGRTARTRRRSTSTGSSAAARSASRCWARRTTSQKLEVVDGELRYYDNRFPIAPGHRRGHRRRRCTPGSTTSWSTGGAPTPTSTTAGSSRSTPSPGCASRTRRSSTPRTTLVLRAGARRRGRRAADRPPGRPGRPEGLPRPAGRGVGRPVDGRGEDPRARRGPAGVLARRPGRRATTRSPRSTRCSSTRPARRRSPRWTPSWPARPVDYARAGARLQARGHRRHARLGGRPAGPGDRRAARHRRRRSRPRRWPSCWPPSRSTAATCPTAASTSTPTVAAVRERRPDLVAGRSTRCTRCSPRPAPRRPPASSRPAARSWPRASRTAPTTGGRGSSRSTRSAATRRASAARVEEFHAAQQRRRGALARSR